MEIANRSFSAVGGGFADTVPSPFDAGSDPIALGQQHSDHHQVMGEGEPHNVHDPISITEPVSATVQAPQSPFSQLNVHTPLPGQEQTTSADTTQPLTVQNQGQTSVQAFVDMTLPPSNDISSTDFFSTTSLSADLPTGLPTSSEQVSSAPPLSLASAQPTTTDATPSNSIQTDFPQAPALDPPQLPHASTAPAPQPNTPISLPSQAPTPIPSANPPPPPQYEPQFQSAPQPPPAHIPHPVEQLPPTLKIRTL
ncbi:hypothetical protein KEM56_005417 [Ascosphaera pollenicola]|nr:hypothetical protein KEM56_005417 [Ascosphaera pollenicola]